ncbi:MAG: CPBP family intramembrane metalloprotease [Bacteroidales bacterium]|nr:CPBP family intramembrane metalloprotease [Bacteroidales bacterium]
MRRYTSAARMPLWKWILCLLGGVILFMLLYGAGWMLDAVSNPWLRMSGFVLASLLGLFIYAVWTNLTEHRPVTELTLKRTWSDLGLGMLLGILFFGVVTGLMALAGCYRISEAHFDPILLLLAFFQFFFVAVYEEIIFRGVLFRLIDDRWNTLAALIVSALLFGAIHMMNPGATVWSAVAIAVSAGLLLGAGFKGSGTLWLPIGLHWAWNFVEGNVFGFFVSGTSVQTKIFSAVITGPDWLTGGRFGAEAAVPTVVVGLLLTVILLARSKRDTR